MAELSELELAYPQTPAARAAAELAVDFLRATEARDIKQAETFIAPDFVACFPRGVTHADLEDWLKKTTRTFAHVAKTFHRIDVIGDPSDKAAVYCSGLLHGAYLSGEEIRGVRFIDRFGIVANRIVSQDVWNDL